MFADVWLSLVPLLSSFLFLYSATLGVWWKISCPPISIHLRHQTIIHPYTLLTHASSTPSLAYPPRKKEKKKQNSLPHKIPKFHQNFTPPALKTQPQHLYML